MSYANGTPFLNLAQTIGTDHRDWFDENEAKLDLDTKMKTLWDGAADTAAILSALQESVGTLQTDVTTLQGTVSGHTSSITTINESLVLINTALNALNTQVTNKFDSAGIADPYDATHGTYDIGDVVTYNGQRYVCSTAVTAAEPFDVSKWSAKDIQSEFDEIKGSSEFGSSVALNDGVDYTTPCPGYLSLAAPDTSGAGGFARASIKTANSLRTLVVSADHISGNNVFNSVYVQKGVIITPTLYGTGSGASFVPLNG